ncbi:MAG: pyruvate kinase [Flavobacteriales bacterium CG18_big_fil_WC_8_21_14_2_50_32_9]|nr:MAG: pyruvate kinase [Flavobacteriales bacterium CG18_big_fil_WC_8_21_14_2_50_32_9]PJC62021.1 MAG: pyruvate kinase [Flavobacteriales bacterium CG_4_9_14_0_2_um_filter_32_27]
MNLRKTKIVATIGPATSSKEMLSKIINAGVNVCRVNFSHGSYKDHEEVINNIRAINKEQGRFTAILADLQGPKIRIGKIEGGSTFINNGDKFVLTSTECIGNNEKAYISYQNFPNDVQTGEKILMDDGKLQLEVVSTNRKDEVITKVIHGGTLSSNKGVNLPNTKVSLPSLTEKDLADLQFALKMNIAWIGLSFVRNAKDIIELKSLITKAKSNAKIVAKIEKPEAIDVIDEIIKETDAVMVARGDLGVEIPFHKVPLIQKMIVKKCMRAAKPVIIATQMMESMIENITPTRAEVNDVANAVLDGADAVMLSAETSVGKHPIEVINAMANIIENVETSDSLYNYEYPPEEDNEERYITDSICFNSCRLAQRVNASAIVTMTFSGYTGFKISSFRPRAGIFVFTGNKDILNMLSLVWGVKVFYYDKFISTDDTISDIKLILKQERKVNPKDLIINLASMPITEKGQTNMMKLSVVE